MSESQLRLALVLYELGMSFDVIEAIVEVDKNELLNYQKSYNKRE